MYNYLLHIKTSFLIRRKQVWDAVSPKKSYSYTAFVILCDPRSGSTLLHTYLNSHPHILSYGEILRDYAIRAATKNPVSDVVFTSHAPPIAAVGLKLFHDYFTNPAYRPWVDEIIQRVNIKVIHLTRKDLLLQYVSLKIAEKTNVWSSGNVSHERQQISIDGDDYLHYVQGYQHNQYLASEKFKNHVMLEIAYEDLTENPQKTLSRVQEFLNVKPRNLFTLLKKQNTDSLESLILNYDDLKKAITDHV
jgi:hypothetical protein